MELPLTSITSRIYKISVKRVCMYIVELEVRLSLLRQEDNRENYWCCLIAGVDRLLF